MLHRNKCAACYVIATDIDAVRSILHADTSLVSVLERRVLRLLGIQLPLILVVGELVRGDYVP